MKPKELFVGAWVNYLHTEDGIAPYKEPICISAEDICRDECIIEAHFEPIPITPEILEKNGWTHYEDDKDDFHDRDCVFLKLKEGGYGVCIAKVRTISGVIKYVHELQAALRLCKIEKEIVL